MINTTVKVIDVIKDRIYDCIVVDLDGLTTQIVFSKDDNVAQYLGSEITLSKIDGCDFAINAPVEDEEFESETIIERVDDVDLDLYKEDDVNL